MPAHVALDPFRWLESQPLVAALLASLFMFIVASVVLNRDTRRSENRSFFAMIALSVLSNLNAAVLFFGQHRAVIAQTPFRLIYALGGLTMFAMVLFAHAFPFNRKASRGLFLGLGGAAVVQSVSSLLVPGQPVVLWYTRSYFLGSTLLAGYYIWRNYRLLDAKSERIGLIMVQSLILLRYIMMSTILALYRAGVMPSHRLLVTNFILAPPVLSVLLAYGLVRFRLLGFRFFLSRSVAYFLVSSGALLLYSGALFALHRSVRWALQIDTSSYVTPVVIVPLLLAFHPIRIRVEEILDHWLDRGFVRAKGAVESYYRETVNLMDVQTLCRAVNETVQVVLPGSHVALLMGPGEPRLMSNQPSVCFRNDSALTSGKDNTRTSRDDAGTEEIPFPEGAAIIDYFNRQPIPFLERSEAGSFPSGTPEALEVLRCDLVVPFRQEGRVQGVMLVQTTMSDVERIRLLVDLAVHLGLQLENAQLYQNVLKANAALTRANRDLDDTRLFLESVFESVPVGIIVLDRDGRVAHWNRAMGALTGISREEAVRLGQIEHLLPSLGLEEAARAGQEHGVVSVPFEHRLRIGERDTEAVVHVRVSTFFDRKGDLGGTVIVVTDVTEQKTMQQALERSKRLAALGQFAAAMAHELRTPMTSIQMNVQILAGKVDLPPEDLEYFDIILTELDRLNRTISDVLDFARPLKLIRTEWEVRDLVDEVVRGLYFLLAERGVEVIVDVPEGLTVNADGERIKQVLINLIDNASHAITEKVGDTTERTGEIRISASSTLENGGPRVLLEVADQGCGMSEEALEHLFDPFYTTRATGTGLGLAIAKKIVEAHGGTLTATSSLNEGSRFVLALPCG